MFQTPNPSSPHSPTTAFRVQIGCAQKGCESLTTTHILADAGTEREQLMDLILTDKTSLLCSKGNHLPSPGGSAHEVEVVNDIFS